MKILLLAALLLLPHVAGAQIYKSVDEQGNVSFSDTPPNTGPSEEVEVRVTNSTPAPEAIESLQPLPDAGSDVDEEPAVDYQVEITSPEDETTIAMGPGNFAVTATIDPGRQGGELLQLYIDGTPAGEPQPSNMWGLTNVFRGAHDLTVAVLDKEGKQLSVSDPVRVYVLRPSVNFR